MMDNLSTCRLPADSWTTTEVKSQSHKHVWTINGFSQLECRYLETSCKINDISSQAASPHQQQVSLPSGSGGVPDQPAITFRIRLHPQGNKESNKDFTFFQVCFTNNQNAASTTAALNYKAKFKFTVYNGRNEETPTTVYSGTQQLHGYFEYIRRDVLISHLQPNDELQLSLAITVTFDSYTKTQLCVKPHVMKLPEPDQINKDFENLFRTQRRSDFIIVVEGREIKTHTAVLAARSEVFAAMLEPYTQESIKGRVEINDVDYDVMQAMLYFLYTGKTPPLGDRAIDIIALADRYQVTGLKDLAENYMRQNLHVDTVCRQLSHCDVFQLPVLKADAIRFIVYNMKALIGTESFISLSREQPTLLMDIMSAMTADRAVCPAVNQKIDMPSYPPPKRSRLSETNL